MRELPYGLRWIHGLVLVAALVLIAATATVLASHDEDCLKSKGMASCVQTFAAELNQAVDLSMRSKGVAADQATKVVPLLDTGLGSTSPARATIGAAQVIGPAAAVERVRAVALYPGGSFGGSTAFRSRVFVPTDTVEPWKKLSRIAGVGVSAIIVVKGCNAWPDSPPDGCR